MNRAEEFTGLERWLGSYTCGLPGPLVIVVGGVHGNEPAGVHAARRMVDELYRRKPRMRGRLVALAGNIGALRERERFLDKDLNRLWTEEELADLETREPADDRPDEAELRELLGELDALLADHDERVILLDLHSTSASGAPFTIMADTLQNRPLAFALHMPVILGLEERVQGTLLSYFSEKGHEAICVEGGQNDAPETIDHHEAAIWVTLVEAGMLESEMDPFLEPHRACLVESAAELPQVVELRYRHPIRPGEQFEMVPGYTNFRPVEQGEILAGAGVDLERTIRTPTSGLLLMPRYQGQGHDGFFLGREVRPIWLRVSAFLRRLRVGWMLRLLPGVERGRDRDRVLLANPHVARWLTVELFHLFGYRKSAREAEVLIFVRRPDRL